MPDWQIKFEVVNDFSSGYTVIGVVVRRSLRNNSCLQVTQDWKTVSQTSLILGTQTDE